MNPFVSRPMLLAAALLAPMLQQSANATCGASFCMVNTNWNLQGFAPEPGSVRFDLRYEYIKQDQPMSGSDRVAFGQIPRHHDELRTTNRNWLVGVDYTFNADWGVFATIPVVDRDHEHIHNHRGAQILDTWDFTRVGDVRVIGRRQWMTEDKEAARLSYYGVNLGLKLPTGDRDITNSAGQRAERTLQPGTGTTDVIFGGYYSGVLPFKDSSWFAQALWQSAFGSREDYKPGQRWTIDLGYRYELNSSVGLMLQLNALHRSRDSGAEAEPEDSGGKSLFLSPGISVSINKDVQIYGFLQLPLYQYVNGVQLTADWAGLIGLSVKF